MRIKYYLLLIALSFALSSIEAQLKPVELQDIVKKGTFIPKTVRGLRSMSDGAYYTKVEEKGSQIVQYSYKTGKAVKTLFNASEITYEGPKSIQDYIISPTGERILVYANRSKIYRHSFTADYYLYDVKRKTAIRLSDDGGEQSPVFSPDGLKVSFVKRNNLYYYDIRFKTITQVTKDGAFNKVINGVPDWVYEEEFGFNTAHCWSNDGRFLAFLRFDESEVKEYSFPVYQGLHPSKTQHELYPGYYTFKYPKAGEQNSKVSAMVFDSKNKALKTMKIAEENEDYYIPRIQWTQSSDQLAVFKLNRHQNKLEMWIANPKSTLAKIEFVEESDTYISDMNYDNYFFLMDGISMICLSERDGYNHIYKYNLRSQKLEQVTKGEWEVTHFYGYDAKLKRYYYQAAAKTPMEREIYVQDKKGRTIELSKHSGTNKAIFSKSLNYFINSYSSKETPTKTTVYNYKGEEVRVLEDNAELEAKLEAYNVQPKEFFSFSTSNSVTLNGWMVLPTKFDSTKHYPLLMVQYSGPNSQQVLNRFSLGWEQVLANEGYVVACVDGRGTGARGTSFRKCTYMQLGHLESDDQIEAAKYLGDLDFVDKEKIGIWGWSYGGFMSSLCLSRSDVFKVGIAVAPVSNFKFYDTVYTERFMRTPNENPDGYNNYAPLNLAENVSGRLFLIHGTADDNVHYQNTIEYSEALVQANKQFDMMTYNNRNHSIYGNNTRFHLYTKKIEWLNTYLK